MMNDDFPMMLTYDDVLILPGHSTVIPVDTDVRTHFARGIAFAIPVLSSAMDTVTESAMAIAMAHYGGLGIIHRNMKAELQAEHVRRVKSAECRAEAFPAASLDETGRLRVGAAIGVGSDWIERAVALVAAECDVIVVDTAHGHSQKVIDTVAQLRHRYPELAIAAGNVAIPEAVTQLARAGADVIKIGVGPGSICTTRIVTGVGAPQFSAIRACTAAAREYNVTLIADGGIRFSGDVAKALAGGAHSVMIGSLFAGTDQSPGTTFEFHGKKYKHYRGMGSLGAMEQGSKDRYFQMGQDDRAKLVPEGIEGAVPYKGDVSQILYQLVGGLRSAMGYVGAATLSDFRERSRFVRVTSAGQKEGHVHDVQMIQVSPNYQPSTT